MLICMVGSTPTLQSRSKCWLNGNSRKSYLLSFALVCSCSLGVLVSFFIQIHVSFHKNIPPFFYIIQLFLGFWTLSATQFSHFTFIHSTKINTIFHYHPFLPNCRYFLSFQKYYGFSFIEMKPLFSLTGKDQCYCETLLS